MAKHKYRLEISEGGIYAVSISGFKPYEPRLSLLFPKLISKDGDSLFAPVDWREFPEIFWEEARKSFAYTSRNTLTVLEETDGRANLITNEKGHVIGDEISEDGMFRWCSFDTVSFYNEKSMAIADELSRRLSMIEVDATTQPHFERLESRIRTHIEMYRLVTGRE